MHVTSAFDPLKPIRICNEKCEIWLAYTLWPIVCCAGFKIFGDVDAILIRLRGSRTDEFIESHHSTAALIWRIMHRLAQGDLWLVYLLLLYVPIVLAAHYFKHHLAYYRVVNISFMLLCGFVFLSLATLFLSPMGYGFYR